MPQSYFLATRQRLDELIRPHADADVESKSLPIYRVTPVSDSVL